MPPYKQAGSVEIPATCVTEPPYGGGGAPKGPSGVGFSSGALLFFEQLRQAGHVLIAEGSQGRGQEFEQLQRFAGASIGASPVIAIPYVLVLCGLGFRGRLSPE